ncbi:MAG: thioredoxin [Hyphomicrobium sp.]|nr:thioredoxin [Hyphomicrobium sp.]
MEFGTMKRDAGVDAGTDVVKNTTAAAFVKDVIEASREHLVLVDFWAAWCGPCKQLAPILEKIVKSYNGKVKLVKLDTDAHPAIAAQLRIQSLPTVYAFRDGRPLDGFVGAQTESTIRQFIDRLVGEEAGGTLEDAIAVAEEALASGDLQTAAEAFAAVLEEDQSNPVALAGVARCYLKSGDVARAEQMLSLVPPDKRNTPAVEAARAAIDLAGKTVGSAERRALEQKVEVEPSNHQARLDLAVALAAEGDKSGALENLLEIVRRDRKWNEEAARKQLVQLFEAWGPKDEHTIDGRRRLSSILFA